MCVVLVVFFIFSQLMQCVKLAELAPNVSLGMTMRSPQFIHITLLTRRADKMNKGLCCNWCYRNGQHGAFLVTRD